MDRLLGTLAARIALILTALILVFMVVFTVYLVRDRSDEMDEMILQKGVTAAKTGAREMERTLNGIIDNSMFSTNEVFDFTLVPIELPASITKGYAGVPDKAIASARKFHYATTLDSYLDNAILEVEDEFLIDPQIVAAALVDINGYLPTHNSRYSKSLTGDFTRDLNDNRTKRLFNDEVGLATAHSTDPYLKQVYFRDTGETMWNVSAPVYVKGRHWGAFRIGISMDIAAAAISALRWKIVLSMGLLLLVTVVAINWVTSYVTRPLRLLHVGVEKMEKGQLGEDEITRLSQTKGQDEAAGLARVFSRMAVEVLKYQGELEGLVQERTRELEVALRGSKAAHAVAESERANSERLLLNILPKSIADQLKNESGVIARAFTEVTVLFADIVDFTPLSAGLQAGEVVNLLNDVFTLFDELAEKHGLEKIKTIGDAYMVVGGLPDPKNDHATAVAEMALDMQESLIRCNIPVQVRIGINTGPAVAGVIGVKKFAYDLWGDTVNTASRMESHSVAGRIQVSAHTYELLHDHFAFEARGEITVKGLGKVETYFLCGRKTAPDA